MCGGGGARALRVSAFFKGLCLYLNAAYPTIN